MDELQLIRAIHRNGNTRNDEIIARNMDIEIKRRQRSGAKPKPPILSPKEANSLSAKKYRQRKKKERQQEASLKKYDRKMQRHLKKYE
jgi:hypothetical protein